MTKTTKAVLAVLLVVVVGAGAFFLTSGEGLQGKIFKMIDRGPQQEISENLADEFEAPRIPDGKIRVNVGKKSPSGKQTAGQDTTVALFDFCTGDKKVDTSAVHVRLYSNEGRIKESSFDAPEMNLSKMKNGIYKETYRAYSNATKNLIRHRLQTPGYSTDTIPANGCAQFKLQVDIYDILDLSRGKTHLEGIVEWIEDEHGNNIMSNGDEVRGRDIYFE
jgi:hypothetical protein